MIDGVRGRTRECCKGVQGRGSGTQQALSSSDLHELARSSLKACLLPLQYSDVRSSSILQVEPLSIAFSMMCGCKN